MNDSYFAKQPILNSNGDTYGYALLYRNTSTAKCYEGADDDVSTADVINSVFFGVANGGFLEGKRAFLKFTENLILEKTAYLLPKDQIVIEISGSIDATDQLINCCRELNEKGYLIAVSDFSNIGNLQMLIDCCHIVKINFQKDRKYIESTVQRCKALKKIMLAEKIESNDEAEYAKKLGCTLMQGFFFAQPHIVVGDTYNPMANTFCRLMNCLWEIKVDIDDLSEIVSEDPFMTDKLLRLVNSIRSDMSEQISSIKQAVLLLGVNKLKDWIYLVGLQSLYQDGPDERIKVALFRAIFCKGIAFLISKDEVFGEEMYLMGLMSVVVASNDRKTMEAMGLSVNIVDGLMGKGGIYGDTFILVEAYEHGIWSKVDEYANKNNISGRDIMRIYSESTARVEDMFEKLRS